MLLSLLFKRINNLTWSKNLRKVLPLYSLYDVQEEKEKAVWVKLYNRCIWCMHLYLCNYIVSYTQVPSATEKPSSWKMIDIEYIVSILITPAYTFLHTYPVVSFNGLFFVYYITSCQHIYSLRPLRKPEQSHLYLWSAHY